MNSINLVGRLTKAPEDRTKGDTKITVFTLAVNRAFTNSEGKREADFIQIKTFKRLAENCLKYLDKGSLVGVDASIRTGSFQKDGKTVYTMEVIADDVRFYEGKKDSNSDNTNNNNNSTVDDDPFPGGTEIESGGAWPFG